MKIHGLNYTWSTSMKPWAWGERDARYLFTAIPTNMAAANATPANAIEKKTLLPCSFLPEIFLCTEKLWRRRIIKNEWENFQEKVKAISCKCYRLSMAEFMHASIADSRLCFLVSNGGCDFFDSSLHSSIVDSWRGYWRSSVKLISILFSWKKLKLNLIIVLTCRQNLRWRRLLCLSFRLMFQMLLLYSKCSLRF